MFSFNVVGALLLVAFLDDSLWPSLLQQCNESSIDQEQRHQDDDVRSSSSVLRSSRRRMNAFWVYYCFVWRFHVVFLTNHLSLTTSRHVLGERRSRWVRVRSCTSYSTLSLSFSLFLISAWFMCLIIKDERTYYKQELTIINSSSHPTRGSGALGQKTNIIIDR